MFIKEVCQLCGLTKKAVEYYEKQGLTQPEAGGNGYRNYQDEDVKRLKEISVLRKLGLGIPEIKTVLYSTDKAAALTKYKYTSELRQKKLAAQQCAIERLIHNYNIDLELEHVHSSVEPLLTIQEKLVQAFPGTYGMYLGIHFGRFLNEPIDCPEKEEAYHKVIDYLDGLNNLYFPDELKEYIESMFVLQEKSDMEDMNKAMLDAAEHTDEYLEKNKEQIEQYLEIRNSEEFRNSPVWKMQRLLLDFQNQNGYYTVFLPNLKILSSSYREYTQKLDTANQKFLKQYPQSEKFYSK